MLRLRQMAFAVLAVLACPNGATAATFFGEFWDASTSVSNLNAANAVIAAGGPTATFQSSAIDYPQGNVNNTRSSTTLAQYLGGDAASIIGPSSMSITRSVFRFTGFLDLTSGNQLFQVGSDDGFRLTVGGNLVAQHTNSRGFRFTSATSNPGAGRTPFELIYFENRGRTGVEFFVDGALAAPAPVPLPGAFALLLAGLAAFGFARPLRQAA